jgi:hypothetical protein
VCYLGFYFQPKLAWETAKMYFTVLVSAGIFLFKVKNGVLILYNIISLKCNYAILNEISSSFILLFAKYMMVPSFFRMKQKLWAYLNWG